MAWKTSIILGLLMSLLAGCGGSEVATPASLIGTWKSSCQRDDSGPFIAVVQFTATGFTNLTEAHTGASCDGDSFRTTVDVSGSYQIDGSDKRAGTAAGAQLFSWTYGGKVYFDILKIDGQSVRFGQTVGDANTTEANRPLALSDVVFTRY